MSERDLGKALLQLDAAGLGGGPDLRQQTWAVLERDRRRVRRLTALTAVLWCAAAAITLSGLVSFGLTFPRQAHLVQQIDAGAVGPAEREAEQRAILVDFQKGALLTAFSVAVMAWAALGTLALLVASRRATLRQLNAGLLEVGEQLRRLGAAGGPTA
jgi:hypothetical protein